MQHEQLRQTRRTPRGLRWVESVWRDARVAARGLGRAPGYTAIVVFTLTLGIGAHAAVFSIVNGLILRSLPFPEAERLVKIESWHPNRGTASVGPDDFRDWRERSTVFEEMAYTYGSYVNFVGESGEAARITGTEVSSGLFELLGVWPQLGRWFRLDEQKVGTPVIILSHGMWQRRFGGREDILDKPVALDGRSYTVVGVMPASFRFNEDRLCEFWIPLAHHASGRYVHQYSAYGRLRPRVSVATAQAQMSAIATEIEAEHPDTNAGWGVRVTGLGDALRRAFGPALALFWATVAVVFLVACANVANLLLAKGASRGREIAVRRALGAGRWHVVQLMIVESLMLSLAAGVGGLLLVRWAIDLAVAAAPAHLELRSILSVDRNVLLFAFFLSLLTGALTALTPALHALRTDVNRWLGQGGGVVGPPARASGGASAFVVAQVALAVLLIVPAGLLAKDMLRLLEVDLGFRTMDVVAARLHLPATPYREAQQRAVFRRRLLERIRTLPGVVSAGAGFAIPLGDVYSGGKVEIEGRPRLDDWTRMEAQYNSASEGYFRTLGIPLLAGRGFADSDREGAEPVAIVNEVFRRRYLAGVEPIGQRIGRGGRWMTIVGVVGNVRHNGPEHPAEPQVYAPIAQRSEAYSYMVIRSTGSLEVLAGLVRSAVSEIDETVPVEIRTMQEAFATAVSERRHVMTVVAFFSLVALVLSTVGLAGQLWRSVTVRTREIGIRMALGARPEHVVHRVLSRSALLAAVGLAAGLMVAAGLAHLLSSLLFGVSPRDPWVYGAAALLVAGVSVVASWIPARRAAAVSPLDALRHE